MAIQISDDTICINWSEDSNNEEYWDGTTFTWSDCQLIDEIGNGALPTPHLPDHPWLQKPLNKLSNNVSVFGQLAYKEF